MDTTYGKMPEESWNKQIMLELKHWFVLLTEKEMLPPVFVNITGGVPQQFFDWMTVETRPYEFSNMFLYTLPSPRLKFWENPSV